MTTVEWEKSTFAIYWFVILQLFLLLMLLLFLFLLMLFNRDLYLFPFKCTNAIVFLSIIVILNPNVPLTLDSLILNERLRRYCKIQKKCRTDNRCFWTK